MLRKEGPHSRDSEAPISLTKTRGDWNRRKRGVTRPLAEVGVPHRTLRPQSAAFPIYGRRNRHLTQRSECTASQNHEGSEDPVGSHYRS